MVSYNQSLQGRRKEQVNELICVGFLHFLKIFVVLAGAALVQYQELR